MIDYQNAERLHDYYLSHDQQKTVVNICRARKNWNGCDYCDIYAGSGLECWKQTGQHNCVHCERVSRETGAGK